MLINKYRFVVDSTKKTVARYPGSHDIVVDRETGNAVAFCPHEDKLVPGSGFSRAALIVEALEASIRRPISLTDYEVEVIVRSLRQQHASAEDRHALADALAQLRGIK